MQMCALKYYGGSVKGIENVRKGDLKEKPVRQIRIPRVIIQRPILFHERLCQTLPGSSTRGEMRIDYRICNVEITQKTHRNLVRSFDLNNNLHGWHSSSISFSVSSQLLKSVESLISVFKIILPGNPSPHRKETKPHFLLDSLCLSLFLSLMFNHYVSFLLGCSASTPNSLKLLVIHYGWYDEVRKAKGSFWIMFGACARQKVLYSSKVDLSLAYLLSPYML